jgi:hypothetical protein
MKKYFSINRRVIEILVTLLLVFIAAGYYYLIYVPTRENEIIARRFRTLQRIDKNIKEKYQAYVATVSNCISRSVSPGFKKLVEQYNSEKDKFSIRLVKTEVLRKTDKFLTRDKISIYDSVLNAMTGNFSIQVKPESNNNLRKITLRGHSYKVTRDYTGTVIIHTEVEGLIDYREFVLPLLQQNVFDQYIVFNVNKDTSSVVYETFPSGISFNNIDSLFDAKEKVYSSRVVNVETAGQKYLAFLHPSGFARKNDRIIVGLYRQDLFNREKQKLPDKMVSTILFVALFSFLLLPFLRLVVMGKRDRLRVYDVAAVYFSFILLVPSVVLVLLWNKNRFRGANENDAGSRQELAKKISDNLRWELGKAYNSINNLDQLYSVNKQLNLLESTNIQDLGKTLKKYSGVYKASNRNLEIFDSIASLISADSIYRNVPYAFWMDLNGKELANWSFENNPPPGNYKDRQYFKDAKAGNLLPVPGKENELFAIEPHISRVDGKFKLAMAKKSMSPGMIIAGPCLFSSLTNPILPLGFTFSITNASGNTIYDSDTTNNFNENLLEELSDAAAFKTVLQTKIPRQYISRYKEEEFTVWTQPVEGFPWFITIFENNAFNSSVNAQSFSFTMLMMVSVFLLLFFEIVIVFASSSKYSRLLRSKVDLVWIHPRKSRSPEYRFLALFNIILILYLWLYCLLGFSVSRITEYTFLIVLSPLLTAIAILHYKVSPQDESKRYSKHIPAIVILGILVLVLLFAASRYGENVIRGSLHFVSFSIAVYVLMYWFNWPESDKYYLHEYKLMIFSRVFLSTVLPVILCFKCISIFEHRLQERLRLFDVAKKIEAGTPNLPGLNAVLDNQLQNGKKTCYIDSDWVQVIKRNYGRGNDGIQPISSIDSLNSYILKASRIRYNNIASVAGNLDLIKQDSLSGQVFSNIFRDKKTSLVYTIHKTDGLRSKAVPIFISSSGNYQCKTPGLSLFTGGFIFWLLLLLLMVLCYRILGFAIRQLFACHINIAGVKKRSNQAFIDKNGPSLVFVQGVLNSGSNKLLKEILTDKNKWIFFREGINWYDAVVMDLDDVSVCKKTPGVYASKRQESTIQITTAQPLSSQSITDTYTQIECPYPLVSKHCVLDDPLVKCVLFTQFEFNSISKDANSHILKLLEKLVLEGRKKIIISSAIPPSAFISAIEKNICRKEKKESSKEIGKQEVDNVKPGIQEPDCPEIVQLWKYLLGKFVTCEFQEVVRNMNESRLNVNNKNFGELYASEISSLGLERDNNSTIDEEDILGRQKLYSQQYTALWNSLSSEEQFLLFDLAEDGLVNTLNVQVLEDLIDRDLVYWEDNVLYIVNGSFRNFILTMTSKGDLKLIMKDILDGQSWNDYKYPLLIVLAALVYIVVTSNPEKFGNVLPFVTGITAGIPTIIKILSYIKPATGKS